MRSLGYRVEAFASAADFLASPRLAETACLIADVNMPAMTGIELYRHLSDAGQRFRQSSLLPTPMMLTESAP
jgi:FixJ family two-component response regulator